jgi:hypothetical protein
VNLEEIFSIKNKEIKNLKQNKKLLRIKEIITWKIINQGFWRIIQFKLFSLKSVNYLILNKKIM